MNNLLKPLLSWKIQLIVHIYFQGRVRYDKAVVGLK